jgi:hypothetical protein
MNPLQPFALPSMTIFYFELTLLRILLGSKFRAFRAEGLVGYWLEYTYFIESGQAKLRGRSQRGPVEEIVPLYAPGQYSRDEKYIQTSIAF